MQIFITKNDFQHKKYLKKDEEDGQFDGILIQKTGP